jgi:pimeloyl-ACP methyl ester carboxylesterase
MKSLSSAALACVLSAGGARAAHDGPLVSDVYREGDQATFVFEQGGKRIGEHVWSYAGEQDLLGVRAHRFEGSVRVEQTLPLGTIEVRSKGELWTDDFGRPLRFSMRAEAGGTRSAVEISFAGGKAAGTMRSGPTAREVVAAMPPDAFVLANNWIGMLELIAAVAPPSPGAPRSVPVFAVDATQAITLELRHQGTFTGRRGEEEFEGEKYRDSLGEALKVQKDGKLFELEVPAAALKVRRTDEKPAKFEIELPPPPRSDFEREEVVVEHPGRGAAAGARSSGAGDGAGGSRATVKLAGTITRKKGASGKLPAVSFVSGSGGQDRDGASAGMDVGTHEILDRLTKAGFLVLRVDDRGVGLSSGPTEGTTFEDLVADARACVDFLLRRADVDAKRVFVIGHSEGGETAPVLACERPLAGIVLLAAPGRSLFEILREQKRFALESAGLPRRMVEAELEEHGRALELLTSESEVDPGELRVDYRPERKNRAWYRSHARHDPIEQASKVKCPVLIAQGGKDLQVSAERDAPALERALREAGNRDVTLAVFPELDHLFKKVEGEKASYQEYFKARPVDREFLDEIAAWLSVRRG